jgi:MraZ protein
MRGQYKSKLDDKFRLTLPSKVRKQLDSDLVVVCDAENCLAIYRSDDFDEKTEQLDNASTTNERVRAYQRWLHSRAEDAHQDAQGRVTLGAIQRSWANLEGEVMVVGVGKRLEVWNPVAWAEYSPNLDDRFANVDGEIIPGVSV